MNNGHSTKNNTTTHHTGNNFQQSQDENILSKKAVSFNLKNTTHYRCFFKINFSEHLNLIIYTLQGIMINLSTNLSLITT